MPKPAQDLQLYEVGHYADLCDRPNPSGYVVLIVPDFDALIQVLERERGQRFTPEEIEEKRKEAPAIVLPKDEAAMMIASRSWITEPR